jgi:gamma-glutamyltranspeptidase/glutathione hydrolase
MKSSITGLLVFLSQLLGSVEQSCLADATAERGMVATVHPEATDAAVRVLENGGNAVDAAIAAGLMLGIVDGPNSGIGGGCFILIRRADGRTIAIDGREMAPAAAHREMYLVDGKPQSELSKVGPLASGVPGALAAYELAVRKHGRSDWADLVLPAADVAERGFAIQQGYARRLASVTRYLARYPSSAAILLDSEGQPYPAGSLLKQPDLAATYREIASQGSQAFYSGRFAAACADWMAANGGIMTRADLANYRAIERQPVETRYRGYTIVGFPPPSSGGIHVAQILNTLEPFDLAGIYKRDRAEFTHVVAEAMKLAFADRAYWLGDADFSSVPRGLIDRRYGRRLARQIDPQQATPIDQHQFPPRYRLDTFPAANGSGHTTHVAVADREGNWVAMTQTVNTTFGSKVIIPGTGVVMNNEMDDFSIAPGTPNAFGLLGAEANSVAAGKRPLSSMSPTIVLRRGQPLMTIGAAGGPKIITQSLLGVICRIDLKMSVDELLAFSRFHHQWQPDRLLVEANTSDELISGLQQRGHMVQRIRSVGVSQVIIWDPVRQLFHGSHDPRVEGKAAGPR